jgi:type II secretory pathway component PulF
VRVPPPVGLVISLLAAFLAYVVLPPIAARYAATGVDLPAWTRIWFGLAPLTLRLSLFDALGWWLLRRERGRRSAGRVQLAAQVLTLLSMLLLGSFIVAVALPLLLGAQLPG